MQVVAATARCSIPADSTGWLVCGIADFAADAATAAVASDFAARLGLGLLLVHVESPPIVRAAPHVAFAARNFDAGADRRSTQRALAQLAARLSDSHPTAAWIATGDSAESLLRVAREENAALIALGSHGTAWTRVLHASPAPAILAGAPSPVLVVPDGVTPTTRWRLRPIAGAALRSDADRVNSTRGEAVSTSIVCGVDGSPDSRAALHVAHRLSQRLGLRLVAAHVAQPVLFTPGLSPGPITALPAMDELRAGEQLLDEVIHDEGLETAEPRALHGFPAERLADLADEEDAELIVVGSRGRGAFRAAFLGSVSNELIGIARCPVVVVPPGAVAD